MINQNRKSKSKNLGNFNGKCCLNIKPPKKEKTVTFTAPWSFLFLYCCPCQAARHSFTC